MKINEKWTLFLIATFVTFFGIANTLLKGTKASTLDENMIEDIKNGKVSLTYELFGAKGDGVTNDYLAIKETHDFANKIYIEEGISITVNATEGKTYYLSLCSEPIDIITDVDWNNANFILDDYVDENNDELNDIEIHQPIFNVTNSIYVKTKKDSNAIDGIDVVEQLGDDFSINKLDENLLDIVNMLYENSIYQNDEFVRNQYDLSKYWGISLKTDDDLYLRKNINETYKKEELLVIDSTTGDVVTDINWDYNDLTSVLVFPLNNNDLSLENGTFLTRTNNVLCKEDGSFSWFSFRNIRVNYTGNVLISNVHHMVDERYHLNEKPHENQTNSMGNRYMGFLQLWETAFVNIKDSSFTPRTTGGTGTYDLFFWKTAYVYLDNVSYKCSDEINEESCYKNNMIDSSKWGIMGTNYGKNLFITNSKLNRIDAHAGITNLYVSDTVVGSNGFTLMGNGYFYANNVKVDGAKQLVSLRDDFGSSWDGTMVLENIHFISGDYATPSIISATNDQTHNFGYRTYFPNVYINNIDVDVSKNNLFDYLSVIYPDQVEMVDDDNSLYYFHSNFYIQNLNINDNKMVNLFPTYWLNDSNFYLNTYGGTNKVKLYLDNDIKNNIIEVDNPKFEIVNEMEFSFDTIEKYLMDLYGDYENLFNFIDFENIKKGDINLDGIIDKNDMLILAKYLINDTSLDIEYLDIYDINENNKIDLNDLIKLARYVLKYEEL